MYNLYSEEIKISPKSIFFEICLYKEIDIDVHLSRDNSCQNKHSIGEDGNKHKFAGDNKKQMKMLITGKYY